MRTREQVALLRELAKAAGEMKKEQKQRPKKIRQINQRVVEEWYDDYIPEHYDRTESFFDVLVIKETADGGLDLSFDTDGIEQYYHHQDAAIIYNNSFRDGYHGGSLGQADQMGFSPAEPSWRVACGNMWWDQPAIRSFSIEDKLEKEIQAYNEKYNHKLELIERGLERLEKG